jgi:adenine-specific DNA-methyltransferase
VLGTSNWNKYLSFGLLSYNYRGIDEDIFGKSYETFLAVGRKEHGIYYTPALITNYMSDLLVTRLFSELKDRLLKAVNEEPRDFKLAHQLVKIINNIKIADIAGGSGSFLVKILRAIWLIYMELQEKTVWSTHREALFDPLSELKGKVGNIRKMLSLGQEYFDERKALASVILKHLYMVDIDERAVDVAKANIWKEAVKIAPKSFRYAQLTGNIEHVLPNLELNFIVANSLVDIPLVQCLKIIKDNFKEDIVRLHAIRKSYLQDPYNTTLIESAIDIKKKIKAFLNKAYADLKYMINVPPLFPPLEFFFCYFDEHGDFLEEGEMGFDGTIGNPPYVRHESIQEIKPFLAGAYESFYCGTADLYTYFYKRCTDLLKYGGYLCYITPNKFMRAAYGENTRILLTTTTTPLIVIDFNDLPIFEEATTYPAILFVEKLPPRVDSVTKVATFSSMEQVSVIKETIETIGFNMPVSALKPEYWILKKPDVLKLMEKLRKMGTPLGEYVNGKIYRGILTGLNEAFVINTTTRIRLIDEEPGSVDLIEPWLRGRDIRKWKATWAELYFINIHSSANHKWIWSEAATEKEAEYMFMEAYPAVYRHLSKWKKQLQKRDDQGKFWWELRSCAYYDAFEQPKIIYPDIAQAPKFTWDESGAFLGNTAYIIPSDEKWLVGLLNSHLVWWFYKNVSSIIQGGYVRFIAQYMESIPIPSITDKQKISIIDRVQKILSDPTNIGVSNIESEINDLIYTLYDLTSEEIKLIKENSP